jgi:hypothetical protein
MCYFHDDGNGEIIGKMAAGILALESRGWKVFLEVGLDRKKTGLKGLGD